MKTMTWDAGVCFVLAMPETVVVPCSLKSAIAEEKAC